MTPGSLPADGRRDFDFWMGRWTVRNRRLKERLKGCTEWEEFDATCIAQPLLDGIGNEDEFRGDFKGPFIGLSFRFFDIARKRWSIYWADNRHGRLEPPVHGTFSNNVGHFEGDDQFEGKPIRVRFLWSRVDTPAPRWEQAFSTDGGTTWETNWIMDMTRADAVTRAPTSSAHTAHLGNYSVVELRRYTIKPGERAHFSQCFENYFPEAFQQLGALVFGQFLERGNDSMFTWLRGYRDMDARATVCASMYYGPLWKEHRQTMNARLIDSDNVMLLRPIKGSIPVLPAVDPVAEPLGARGVVVAQVFSAQANRVDELATRAAPFFERYQAAGLREVAILATLGEPNNFPQHPVREDGPFLVWLGLFDGNAAVNGVMAAIAEEASRALATSGLLREPAQLLVMDPAPRSRLRWLG